MGGCRCIFRKCWVNTENNPGMHFFRFPLKHSERFKKWLLLADAENILQMPESRQRNKVVCGRHFPEDAFMNYKQDRLTRTALPTLHRLDEVWAIDYSEVPQEPKLIRIEKSNMSHLIPPKDFPCPLRLNERDRRICEMAIRKFKTVEGVRKRRNHTETKSPKSKNKLTTINSTDIDFELNEETLGEDSSNSYYVCLKEPINTIPEENEPLVHQNGSENNIIQSITLNEDHKNLSGEIIKSNAIITDENTLNNGMENLTQLRFEEQLYLEKQAHAATKQKLEQSQKEIYLMQLELNKHEKSEKSKISAINNEIFVLKSTLKESIETNAKLQKDLNAKIEEQKEIQCKFNNVLNKYEDIELKYKNLQIHYQNLIKQQEKELILTSAIQQQKIQQQPLTKLQLFNGIKKYLSQTMVALLRIQLSSGSIDREWKPDERRVALDLFSLGERVYQFFTDEWLLRLPSLNHIHIWLENSFNYDDEEDL